MKAKKFFPTQKELICRATEYAKQQGAEIENGPMQCHWWCRSPADSLLAGLNGWTGCMINCRDLLRVNAERGGEKMPHCNAMIRECIGYVEEILQAKGKLK